MFDPPPSHQKHKNEKIQPYLIRFPVYQQSGQIVKPAAQPSVDQGCQQSVSNYYSSSSCERLRKSSSHNGYQEWSFDFN